VRCGCIGYGGLRGDGVGWNWIGKRSMCNGLRGIANGGSRNGNGAAGKLNGNPSSKNGVAGNKN